MHLTLPNNDSSLEALGDIWAILALVFLALFIGIVALLLPQGPPDLSDELAQENAQIAAALSSAAASVQDAKTDLAKARNSLSATQQALSDANGQIQNERSRADAAENAAKDAVAKAQEAVASAQQQAESATQRADEAERKLATKALEVMFNIDVSGSMADEHKRLGPDKKLLAEALAPLAPLSIGCVAYLNDRRTFNLQPIADPDSDGGQSLNGLKRFIDSYEAKGGNVDLWAAVRESMAMLNRSNNQSAKRTIVILSDVSVYETRNENEATQMIRELGSWVRSSQRHAVLVIFTGNENKDRNFYQRLAEAGGSRVTVSENPSQMLPELLRAMTSR